MKVALGVKRWSTCQNIYRRLLVADFPYCYQPLYIHQQCEHSAHLQDHICSEIHAYPLDARVFTGKLSSIRSLVVSTTCTSPLGLLSIMHLKNSLVPLMVAMITVVLANPLTQPSETVPRRVEQETINIANRQILGPRQIPGFPFIDLFVKDSHAAQSADTIPSSKTPSQKAASPKQNDVYTYHGPLIIPVGGKDAGQLDNKGIPFYSYIDRFVKNQQAAKSTGTTTSSGVPSQKYTNPRYTHVDTSHGPLTMSVREKDSSELEPRGIPGFPSIDRFVKNREAPKSTSTPREPHARVALGSDTLRSTLRIAH